MATIARCRRSHQVAQHLSGAQQHQLEVAVGLVAARDVANSAAPGRAVPCDARRARSRRCDVHPSACRCKNVLWSCLCSAMKMCVGVCTVGARARVLARACVCVLRRGCRTSLLAQETARPFPSCATTGPGLAREGTRHGGLFTESFFALGFFRKRLRYRSTGPHAHRCRYQQCRWMAGKRVTPLVLPKP